MAAASEIIRKTIECCFIKGRCTNCPFYNMPVYEKAIPGHCMGMKNVGNILLNYLDDMEGKNNGKNGKKSD